MSLKFIKKERILDVDNHLIRTEKHEAQKTEISFQDLYENSPVLCRTINTDGIIIKCNKLYAESLGYTMQEVMGSSIFEHTLPQDHGKIRDSFESWKRTGTVKNRVIIFVRKNGTKFPGLITANNIYDNNGKLIGSNTVINDITETLSNQTYNKRERQNNKKTI